MTLSWVHSISQLPKTLKKPPSTTDSHHSSRQKHEEWKEVQRRGRWLRYMSRYSHTLAQAVTVSSFDATAKYRQRNEQARNVTA
jgi:hypothetical protein